MTNAELNTIIDKLNEKARHVGVTCVPNVPIKGHLTQSKLEKIVTCFQNTYPAYCHTEPKTIDRLQDTWTDTPRKYGVQLNGNEFIVKGWDNERKFTPMQHIAPRVWLSIERRTLPSQWDELLSEIDVGCDLLQWIPLPVTGGESNSYSWYTDKRTGKTTENESKGTATSPYTQVFQCYDYANADSSVYHQNVYSVFSNVVIKNPCLFPIRARILYSKHIFESASYYISDGGDCTMEYTLPESLEIEYFDDGSANVPSSNYYRQKLETSYKDYTYATQDQILQPNESIVFGPTEYSLWGVREFLKKFEDFCEEHTGDPYGGNTPQCSGGRWWYILARYQPSSW